MSASGLAGRSAVLDLEEKEYALEYLARIKIHNPTDDGVLVELNGEFDLLCLEALRGALDQARALGRAVFVDLSGVGFMDALCTRELLRRTGDGSGRFELCQPSLEASLSAAALGLWGGMKTSAVRPSLSATSWMAATNMTMGDAPVANQRSPTSSTSRTTSGAQ